MFKVISSLLYLLLGFLLGFCRPRIGPQALRENNDLVLAKQSICYIGYECKLHNRYRLLTKCEVKVAAYWPLSDYFLHVYGPRQS